MTTTMVHSDGGRNAAGFTGTVQDCAVRALSISTGHSYTETHSLVSSWDSDHNPDNGTALGSLWDMMSELGYSFTQSTEIPSTGTVVVLFTTHVCAVVDNVVFDLFNAFEGTAKVHGYWTI